MVEEQQVAAAAWQRAAEEELMDARDVLEALKREMHDGVKQRDGLESRVGQLKEAVDMQRQHGEVASRSLPLSWTICTRDSSVLSNGCRVEGV